MRVSTAGWCDASGVRAWRAMAFRRCFLAILLSFTGVVIGCGGNKPMPTAGEAQLPAEASVGDTTLRVTTLPAMRLNEAMARQYGVTRDASTVLVVAGMRRGTAAQETSLPGRVTVRASDLLGARQDIALREMRSEGFIDYVGTARVSMPDTLRYEVDAQPEGGPALSLRFHRDYFP